MTTAAASFNVNVSSRFNLLPDEDDTCNPEETVQKIIQAHKEAPVTKPKKENTSNGVLAKGSKVESKASTAAPAKVVPIKPPNGVQTTKPVSTMTSQKADTKPITKPSKPFLNSTQEPPNPAVSRTSAPRFNKFAESTVTNNRFEEDGNQVKENHFKQPRHFTLAKQIQPRAQREFDRHSGSDKTGVKPIEKKDGAGAHNWGTFEDDLKAEAAIQQNDPSEYSGLPSVATVNGEETQKSDSIVPEIPTAKLMTLQEYKAQQSKEMANMMSKLSSNSQKPEKVRIANDGADFGDMVAYKKVQEEYNDDEDEVVEGPTKQIVPIDIRFNDSDARGRGGAAGGGFRGRGVGGRPMQNGGSSSEVGVISPNAHLALDDEAAFPKLK